MGWLLVQLFTFSMAVSGRWSGQLALVYVLVASVQVITFSMAVSGHWSGQLAHVLWLLVNGLARYLTLLALIPRC
jgi:hypothetical protein